MSGVSFKNSVMMLATGLLLAVCCGTVDASIYWSDPAGTSGSHVIRRANNDGTGATTVVTNLRDPRGIAVDISRDTLFWTEPGDLALRASRLDGTGIYTVASAQNGVSGVAYDTVNGKVYWTDSQTSGSGPVGGNIRRANYDGTDVETLIADVTGTGIAIDVANSKVYWSELNDNRIRRANLNGTGIEDVVTGVDEVNGLALDVANGHLYWTELTSGVVSRSNLDGSNVSDLVTGLTNPTTIALEYQSQKMYWTDSGPSPTRPDNLIQRANFDGSDVETLISGVGFPWGIAVTANPVPEPATIAVWSILGLCGVGYGVRRKMRRAA